MVRDMDDEYEQILKLFTLDIQEKENKLDEIFRISMEFIEKYKYIQKEGSEREQREIETKLEKLRIKIAQEAKISRDKLNLSEKDVEELSKDKSNFTEEQWRILQETNSSIHNEELALKKERKKITCSASKHKGRRKIRTKKSSWLKS